VVEMGYNYIRVKSEVFQQFRKLKHLYMVEKGLTNISDSDFLKHVLDFYEKSKQKERKN